MGRGRSPNLGAWWRYSRRVSHRIIAPNDPNGAERTMKSAQIKEDNSATYLDANPKLRVSMDATLSSTPQVTFVEAEAKRVQDMIRMVQQLQTGYCMNNLFEQEDS
jgi:hypothetical protein